jgi:outer membrane lipoprotein-sorting protein
MAFRTASRLFAAFGAVAALACAAPALARPSADLAPDQQALVARAQDYIQGLKTVTARFTQTDANGQTTTGTLYLQRPGKARFQYDPPSGLLVVSDGTFVAVSDTRLKTFSEYPLGRTPLILLLGREVRLDRADITGVDETPNGFALTARGHGDAQGRLTLLFRNDPVELRGWNLVDAQGRETRVRFGALTPAERLAPGLFYPRDPRH